MQETVDALNEKNLSKMVGQELEVIVDGESDEHEFLLSAKALHWAPDIDGEIYINESEIEPLAYGVIYKAKISDIAGSIALATILAHA